MITRKRIKKRLKKHLCYEKTVTSLIKDKSEYLLFDIRPSSEASMIITMDSSRDARNNQSDDTIVELISNPV